MGGRPSSSSPDRLACSGSALSCTRYVCASSPDFTRSACCTHQGHTHQAPHFPVVLVITKQRITPLATRPVRRKRVHALDRRLCEDRVLRAWDAAATLLVTLPCCPHKACTVPLHAHNA